MTRPTPAPAQTAAPPVPAPAPVPTAPASSSNVAGPSTPPPLPVAAPVMATPPMRPPIRPSISTTSSPTPVLTQQPPSMMTPPIAIPGTSHLSTFGQQPLQPIGPPGIGSPQGSFVPHSPLQQVTMNGGFPSHLSYANSFPQPGGIGLGPSALPRGYPTPIEPGFDNSLPFGKAPPPGMPPPIGPPKPFGAPGAIGSGVSLPSPITGGFPSRSESLGTVNVNGMGGHIRRGSLHEPITPVGRPNPLLPAFGAVQRPMPISRPAGAPGMQQQSDGEERPASPIHLGSRALINDDDDIIMPAGGRRINPSSIVTNGWGAPGEMSKIPNDPFVRGLIGPSSSWSAGGGLHQSPGGLWGAGPVASPGGVNPFMNHHQSPPHQQGMPPMPPFGMQNFPNRPLNPPPSSSPQGN
ncbi:hypothetical protein DL93DRAFT_1569187 [Clavulina sp. PMI_390]|nr:hypothetical protein DL93DRAFT_1569187 [Clavulina sp. PMI_390]